MRKRHGPKMPSLDHDPGTPDKDVSPRRLAGRLAFRSGRDAMANRITKENRTQWWLGWFDEKLRRFYDR